MPGLSSRAPTSKRVSSNEILMSDRGGTARFRPSVLTKYAFDDIDEEDEFESY